MRKQPKILNIYFLSEMWERFGFYVIQTLLIFYLINNLHLSDELSYGILGSITALAYSNAVIGGYIADRLIGQKATILLASTMLIISYGTLSISHNIYLTLWALAFITMGVGLQVPSIRSLVGLLYDEKDERRQSGFTFCYIGVNTGIMMSSTFAGIIQRYFGWSSVFFSASLVLFFCFSIFFLGTRYLKTNNSIKTELNKKNWFITIAIILATVILSYCIISHKEISSIFFFLVAITSMAYIFYAAYKSQSFMRQRFIAFLLLMLISTLYWAMYFQMFFSMNLFIERVVDRTLGGIVFVPTIFPAIEALSVILVGLFLVWGWHWLQSVHPRLNPTVPTKFTLALLIQCLAFGLFFLGSKIQRENGLIQSEWLIPAYILIGVGELFIMPISLAMVSELLPPRVMGVMMGILLITVALGAKLAGVFADIANIPTAVLTDIPMIEHIYQHSFFLFFIYSLILFAISLCLVPRLKRLIICI